MTDAELIARAARRWTYRDPGQPVPGVPFLVAPLKSSHQCRVCSHRLEGDWFKAEKAGDSAGMETVERQMDDGRCDDCTRTEAIELAAAFLRVNGWTVEVSS